MPHSFTRIWIHAVWSTKLREPLISADIEQQVFNYLNLELRAMGCPVRIINGMPDHVHCLFLLNPQKSLTDIIKQCKGYSSYAINKHGISKKKFSWQRGYAAFSVSNIGVYAVHRYIAHQKQHHQFIPFKVEYDSYSRLKAIQKA